QKVSWEQETEIMGRKDRNNRERQVEYGKEGAKIKARDTQSREAREDKGKEDEQPVVIDCSVKKQQRAVLAKEKKEKAKWNESSKDKIRGTKQEKEGGSKQERRENRELMEQEELENAREKEL
ncbi:297_t:CDS:2, partial [Racocetra fulgida]